LKLSELGERRAIEIFESIYGSCEEAALALGDDACILELDPEHYLVVSTDLLSRRTHFPLEMPPRVIGRYAVNACLSDIAAMGASPIGLLFSYGLPGDTEEAFVRELARGIHEACREHDTCVLGGDTKEQGELLIVGTALGRVKKDRVLTREGARVGDLILVTGMVGSSAAGYYAIIKNLEVPRRFIEAAYEPKARIREGVVLGKYASSCIDISDGLAFSLHEVARASKAGFRIYEEHLPIDEELDRIAEFAKIKEELVFHKGGEYELLFTLPRERLKALEEELKPLGTRLSVIGEITPRGGELVRKDGPVVELEYRGYEAFKVNF
jgi:thiamine-monophosphate kinase